MPKFIADECFSGPMVRALIDAGFDVTRSAASLPGASDAEVLALATSQTRILLTEDTDFGELVVRLGLPTCGVARVVLGALDRSSRAERLVQALTSIGESALHALVTIEPDRTRIRRLLE